MSVGVCSAGVIAVVICVLSGVGTVFIVILSAVGVNVVVLMLLNIFASFQLSLTTMIGSLVLCGVLSRRGCQVVVVSSVNACVLVYVVGWQSNGICVCSAYNQNVASSLVVVAHSCSCVRCVVGVFKAQLTFVQILFACMQ